MFCSMRFSTDRYSLYQITAVCLCILPLQGCFERHKTTDSTLSGKAATLSRSQY
ncbi:hypothetical protein Q8W17_05670 [Photobacterium damselae subsp. piscicida]|nr:hypothetical protein [Photobacterium damselae subsp. piscicida]